MFIDNRDQHLSDFAALLTEFCQAAPSADTIAQSITKSADNGDLYGALKACRQLIDHEAEIMQHVQ